MPTHSPLIVALDYADQASALALIHQLDPKRHALKIGSVMFNRFGPSWVRQLIDQGFRVFLDLKFYDIPQVVAGACQAAADMGVWMLTVHAQGGRTMLERAAHALSLYDEATRPRLLAVTVLTSFDEHAWSDVAGNVSIAEQVVRLADLSHSSGADGLVCSPQEVQTMRARYKRPFDLVTPGIRLSDDVKHDDQKRTLSPSLALKAGAVYIVIGRPITGASDPDSVLRHIELDIQRTIVRQ